MRKCATIVLLTVALIPVAGCEILDRRGRSVEEKIPHDGDYVTVVVTPSSNEFCDRGVRHMRNRDWDLAIEQLERAVQANPNDHRALFAKGVCLEMKGDLSGALTAYKAANLIPSKEKLDYSSSVRRVEKKLGRA